MQRGPNRLTLQLLTGMYDDGCVRQLAKHDCGITPQIGRVRQQDNLNFLPPFMQPPPGHESISSIISLAAENYDALRRSVMLQHIFRDGRAGIFHQRKRRHAEALAGGAVNPSHFFCADNLHNRIVFIPLVAE